MLPRSDMVLCNSHPIGILAKDCAVSSSPDVTPMMANGTVRQITSVARAELKIHTTMSRSG